MPPDPPRQRIEHTLCDAERGDLRSEWPNLCLIDLEKVRRLMPDTSLVLHHASNDG